MSNTRLTALLLALAAGAAPFTVAPLRAADTASDVVRVRDAAGPDMRILTTPEELLFDVSLGPVAGRFQPKQVDGAMGWSVRLAQSKTGEDATWPTPATDGERVFVGGPLHYTELYAMSAENGRLAWKARLTDNGPTPPVVRKGRVYINTQSCTLYAYDARTGGRKWSRYLAAHLESIPAVGEESIVTTRPERHEQQANRGRSIPALTMLDHRGRIQTNVAIDSEALGAPVLHDGKAYLATRKGSLYCVGVDEGEELWRRDCSARGAPWVDDTGVYVAGQEALASFNATTGTARWTDVAITPSSGTREIPVNIAPPPLRRARADTATTDAFWGEGMRPVAVADRMCIAEGKTLRLFNRVTGAEAAWWELDVRDPFAGPPIVAGDTVIVATRGGQIRGVDARRGEIVWAVDIDHPLGSGVIVDDGKLYAVTRDGRLVCVHTGDLRADGWPMWGGTPTHAAESD